MIYGGGIWIGCVLDVVSGVLNSTKGGIRKEVGGVPNSVAGNVFIAISFIPFQAILHCLSFLSPFAATFAYGGVADALRTGGWRARLSKSHFLPYHI